MRLVDNFLSAPPPVNRRSDDLFSRRGYATRRSDDLFFRRGYATRRSDDLFFRRGAATRRSDDLFSRRGALSSGNRRLESAVPFLGRFVRRRRRGPLSLNSESPAIITRNTHATAYLSTNARALLRAR